MLFVVVAVVVFLCFVLFFLFPHVARNDQVQKTLASVRKRGRLCQIALWNCFGGRIWTQFPSHF